MRRFFLLTILSAVALLVSCSKEEPLLPPLTKGEISGTRLWDRLTADSRYREYRQWPGHDGKRAGQSPHGVMHALYVNRVLYDALPVDEAPEGTILIKENYNSAGTLLKLTAMAKVKGYDPDNNDWFFAAYEPDGTVQAEGHVEGCINCHIGMKSNDYMIIKDISTAP